jgi:hypothetical protein
VPDPDLVSVRDQVLVAANPGLTEFFVDERDEPDEVTYEPKSSHAQPTRSWSFLEMARNHDGKTDQRATRHSHRSNTAVIPH